MTAAGSENAPADAAGSDASQQAARTTVSYTWKRCADEGGTCSFSGTKLVRYGANGKFAYRTATNSIACTNTVFGDPVVGVRKYCEVSSSNSASGSTTTSPTTTDTSSGTTSGTTTDTTTPTDTTSGSTPTSGTTTPSDTTSTSTAPTTRDALKWPFASNSIWNTPIGSNAAYVAAKFPAVPGNDQWAPMPQIDDEIIVLKPKATLTPINYSDAGWTGKNRCSATGGQLVQVPIPSDYVIPNSKQNNSAAFLMADGHTIVQTQPFTRCQAGGSATSIVKFADVDLLGDGRTGAHGGSGLSAIGGSLRLGELRPGSSEGPRHALKVNVFAKEMLYRCTTKADCFRWPATKADSYAVGNYGTATNSSNKAMKMGALLAIPASTNIGNLGLETQPAKQLAWTLQNYGAYIVDDTWSAGFAFNSETGPDGSFRDQFKADWGMTLEQRVNDNSPWSRDVQRLMQALYVVDNNGPDTIGGGGTPRQSLAPALQ